MKHPADTPKTNPIQTQFKANLCPNKPNSKPILTSQPPIKAKTNPIQTQSSLRTPYDTREPAGSGQTPQDPQIFMAVSPISTPFVRELTQPAQKKQKKKKERKYILPKKKTNIPKKHMAGITQCAKEPPKKNACLQNTKLTR
jgi:hypothetical protein